MSILDRIVEEKRKEIADKESVVPLKDLIGDVAAREKSRRLSLVEVLQSNSFGIIAEFKRKSPSKGIIRENAEISEIAPQYQEAGCSAISVLTDERFFGGSLVELQRARSLVSVPLLRKDFIVSEYQVYEAFLSGANIVLLIAAILDDESILRLSSCARQLGLEVLMEVHSEEELKRVQGNGGFDLLGINSRDLNTFQVDVGRLFRMREQVVLDIPLIAESGIDESHTVSTLVKAGFRGFLVGEYFMKADSPGERCRALIREVKSLL